jgi:hypothetical protein
MGVREKAVQYRRSVDLLGHDIVDIEVLLNGLKDDPPGGKGSNLSREAGQGQKRQIKNSFQEIGNTHQDNTDGHKQI